MVKKIEYNDSIKRNITGIVKNGVYDIFYVYELPVLHSKARTDNKLRIIDNTSQQGFLCYGQRRSDYPIIPLQAVFSMAIKDNSKNDQVCLILDVYDHNSDRVIAKEVITRKDFRVANKIDMFTVDFIPPSLHAVLEFRIYYMGGSTISLDKIAVINANIAVVVKQGQFSFSSIEHLLPQVPEEPQSPVVIPQPQLPPQTDSNKPELRITKLGDSAGNITFTNQGFVFDVISLGSQSFGDNVLFASIKSPHRGKIVVRLNNPKRNIGIMIRNSLEHGENYIYLGSYTWKYRVDGNEENNSIDGQYAGRKYLKIVRKGDDFVGQTSENGNAWHTVFSQNIDMESKKEQAIGICSAINGKETISSMGIADFVNDIDYEWNQGVFSTKKR